MKSMPRGPRRIRREGRAGGALVLALVSVVTVAALAATILELGLAVTRRQNHSIDRKRAFYISEAGLAEAFHAIKVGESGQVGTQDEPAVFGHGLLWVETEDLGDGMRALKSTGMYGLSLIHI